MKRIKELVNEAIAHCIPEAMKQQIRLRILAALTLTALVALTHLLKEEKT